eukprot:TRINITY_DN8458_c0_g1_i16.p2 TRINITY_DN8458_c0_g1~~TRINITY_DN8458_c0_g1_i16.p2  ORF type:complete len:189 (-),score=-32.42 TRINITY_DN8458_c0_g1_i16:1017-1583(-)
MSIKRQGKIRFQCTSIETYVKIKMRKLFGNIFYSYLILNINRIQIFIICEQKQQYPKIQVLGNLVSLEYMCNNIHFFTTLQILQQIYLQYLLYYQALLIAADYNTIKFYISYSQPKYLHKIFVQAVFNVLTGVVYWQQQCKYFNKNYNFATFLYKIYVFNIYVLLYMQIDMQYYLHIQEFTTYIQFQK